jgi:magnesium transporter
MVSTWDPERRAFVPGDLEGARWLHVTAPTEAEQEDLSRRYGVPREFLRHAVDVDELARVDHDPSGARLVVLRVPWPRPDATPREPPYRAAALALIFVGHRVLTASAVDLDVLPALAAHPGLAPEQGLRFVVQAALVTADRFLVHLRAVDRRIDELEEELHDAQGNRVVLELLRCQKGLVHFTTALASNRIMLERLQKDLDPEEHALLDDALVEISQAIEMTGVSSNILSQSMDAFASIISNNLNVVMKALTALTIVLALPTVVASLYGMNVALPGADHPLAFWLLSLGSGALAMVAGWMLRGRDWL